MVGGEWRKRVGTERWKLGRGKFQAYGGLHLDISLICAEGLDVAGAIYSPPRRPPRRRKSGPILLYSRPHPRPGLERRFNLAPSQALLGSELLPDSLLKKMVRFCLAHEHRRRSLMRSGPTIIKSDLCGPDPPTIVL